MVAAIKKREGRSSIKIIFDLFKLKSKLVKGRFLSLVLAQFFFLYLFNVTSSTGPSQAERPFRLVL